MAAYSTSSWILHHHGVTSRNTNIYWFGSLLFQDSLGVHGQTNNSMSYGELGMFSVNIQIRKKMIGYWLRLIEEKEFKLSNVLHNYSFYIYIMKVNVF